MSITPETLLKAVTLPAWALVAIIFSGLTILFAEPFGIKHFASFQQWNDYIIAALITAIWLCIFKLIFKGGSWCWSQKTRNEALRTLKMIPLDEKCYWYQGQDSHGTPLVQIMLDIDMANTSKISAGISKITLIKPKGHTVASAILLPDANSPYHSHKHKVRSNETITATLMVLRQVAAISAGKDLPIHLIITDQWAKEYKIKMTIPPAPGQA